MLAQVPNYDATKPIRDQQLPPLYFLSGSFKGHANWATIEKESYAIVESVDRFRHFLIRPEGFRVFTDHRNLAYLFSADPTQKLPARSRLARWAMRLQAYRYTIEHIAGEDNLWADLLSRWGANQVKFACRAVKTRRSVETPRISPLKELPLPQPEQIVKAQTNTKPPDDAAFEKKEGIWYHDDRIWIPDHGNLRLEMMVIGHYGLSGHNMAETTLKRLKKHCSWQTMRTDVYRLVGDCILCRKAKTSLPTRLQMGTHKRASKPNETIHMDYVFIGESKGGASYILVLKDDFSHLVELISTDSPDSKTVVEAVLDWISRHGLPKNFLSDNGTHFRNTILKELVHRLGLNHDFTTPYCPWSNGRIERVNRDLLALFRILINEFKLEHQDWPLLVANVQYCLNQRPSESLAGKCPIEVHAGRMPDEPLSMIFRNEKGQLKYPVDMNGYVKKLQEQLANQSEDVSRATKKRDDRARKNRKELSVYELGDYVIYAMVERPKPSGKLYCKWIGPLQIVDSKSSYVFVLKDLASGKLLDAHVSRMSFYSTKEMDVTVELIEHTSRQGAEYVVDHLVDVVWNTTAKRFEFKVRWSGFTVTEQSLEPFSSLFPQVPLLILEFLEKKVLENPSIVNRLMNMHRGDILAMMKKRKYNAAAFPSLGLE